MSKKQPLTKEQLKQKIEKFVPAARIAGKTIALTAIMHFCTPNEADAQTHQTYDNPTSSTHITYTPTKHVHYQVDSLTKDQMRNLGNYKPAINTITVNYNLDNKNFNTTANSVEALIHEAQHQSAVQKGAYDYPVLPEQAYKRNMYDEIAANIAVLLYKREQYLQTGDLRVFNDENNFFHFYREEINKGTINPHSASVEDFEKEMALIASMTRTQWLIKYSDDQGYKKQHFENAETFADWTGKYSNFHKENYEESLRIICNIGGVDFYEFMKKEDQKVAEENARDPKNIAQNSFKIVEIPTDMQAKLRKEAATYKRTTPATENYPVNESKVLKGTAHYPKWSKSKRVSPIQYADIPDIQIKIPEGYYTQPIVEPTQQEEVIVDNSSKKHSGKFGEKWHNFWGKVGDFFRPSRKEKPQKNSTSTATSEPKATNRISPKPSAQAPKPKPAPVRTPVQNPQKVDTLAQNSEGTVQGKPTAKEKWNNFWENTGKTLGDIFRPSWCEKPEDKPAATPVDTSQSSVTPVDTVQAKTAAPSVQAPNNEIRTPAQPTTTPDTIVQNADTSATTNHISPKALRKKIKKQKSAEIQKQKDTYRKKHDKSSANLSREQAYNKKAAERVARMTKD